LLRAADVTFGYGSNLVLREVTLDVPGGGLVGIIGPNGSGKTTTLRLLAGTRTPQRGAVYLDEVPLTSIPRQQLARRMAVVPQETHLAFDYSVLEVVLMGRYPHLGAFEIEGPGDIAIARDALGSTGTLELESRLFETLSGGEKQRVVIAAALAQIRGDLPPEGGSHIGPPESSLLLLDEPTAALDLKYQIEIGSLVRDLHERHGLSIVLSTHDLNFAAALCDSLVMLKEGRVIASGPVDEVLTPASIRELYDVEAEITRNAQTGRLTVMPVRVTRERLRPERGDGVKSAEGGPPSESARGWSPARSDKCH
jgi:iron complex transport system ATP-binding protein